jgi:paraquat-inducible protein B
VPQARVRRRRWGVSVVWIVPLVAALVAGYLVYERVREQGPTITVRFKDGDGLKAGQTEVRYRGVPVGDVAAIELSADQQYVLVGVQLRRSAAALAREGSVFWIVRPEVGPSSISGLRTVFTGPYIQVLPGTGRPKSEFNGLESQPAALERNGLKIVLAASDAGSIRNGAPVYYRGIQIGTVTATDLNRDSTTAQVHVFINQPYARLVRIGSRFWSVSGLDLNVSLRRGLEINLESLRSLFIGGIALATPDASAPAARDGTLFVLHDKADKEWLQWAPKIPLPPGG